MNSVTVMDCPVAACSFSDALGWMVSAVEDRHPTYLVTLNGQYFWEMSRDATFRDHVLGAGLRVPEYFVVWAGRRLGVAGLEHIGGIDLLRDFLPISARRSFRLYLLGGRPEVVEALAQKLMQRYGPGLLAGWHHGYLSPDDEAAVAIDIRRTKPDAVFVAMGVPKQDYWIREYGQALDIPLCIGVGGSFDVLAGFKKDTPAWARGKGLEWLYRVVSDPRAYLLRYMRHHPWFFFEVWRHKARQVLRRSADAGSTPPRTDGR